MGSATPPAVSPPHGTRPRRGGAPTGLLLTGLIALGLLPVLANVLRRVAESVATEGDASGSAIPVPALVHAAAATVYVLLGAFQFSASLRRRRPGWHRASGRVALVAAVIAAVSGLWLAHTAVAASGGLLYAFRVLAASVMLAAIALGFAAIRRGQVARHRDWMVRAYAIGLGPGTQVFTLGFGEAIFGESELGTALLNGAGWAINLAVAELAIRRRRG